MLFRSSPVSQKTTPKRRTYSHGPRSVTHWFRWASRCRKTSTSWRSACIYGLAGPGDRGLVIGLVQSPEQVVNSPHLAERGAFVELDHPQVGTLKYPGPGFFFDGANPMQSTCAAPRLGEHNAEVYCGRLGLSNEELGRLQAARVI